MRKIILIGLFISSCCCLSLECRNTNDSNSNDVKLDSNLTITLRSTLKSNYEVYKIDSINDYYLIYIVRDKERYKAISKKALQSGCDMISLGKTYNLQVTEVFGTIGGGVFKPNCLSVDDRTKVCIEDSIVDLCYAENLKGLCIENSK